MSPPAPSTAQSTPSSEPSETLRVADQVTVESVTDGDTIVVSGGVRVRLIGIDTPETRHPDRSLECFGPEASARTAALLVPGEPVRLVYDVDRTDRYDRTLAYVHRASDDLFVNAALVEEGYARAGTYPPNVAHDAELHRLEDQARAAGRGLWTACGAAAAPQPRPAPSVSMLAPSDPTTDTCHPAYPDVCIPPAPPNLDCTDVPHRSFRVLPPDPHSFDGNTDGFGCETPDER